MGLLDRLRGEGVSRVAVLGIDGVPYSLLSAHFDEFEHLAAIADEGAAGPIESTVPPDFLASWSSLTTGLNPGKTGVYGFEDREIGSYDTYVPMGNDVQADRVWDHVHNADRTATVLNVPGTFPPQRTVQRMVSGFLATDESVAAHPESVASYLESIGYRLDVDPTLGHDTDKEEFLADARETLGTRAEAFNHFIEQDDWDLFFGVFLTPDRVNHFLFDEFVTDGQYADAFLDFYRTLDEHIGELRAALPDNVTLIVVSEHGATSLEYEVNCNAWLRANDWLSFEESVDYVVQLNRLLVAAGHLRYVPVEKPETVEIAPEQSDTLTLEQLTNPDADLDAVLDASGIAPDTAAIATDSETVIVFADAAVDPVRETLVTVSDPDDERQLVNTVDERDAPDDIAAVFELTPAANVRLAAEHARSGDAVTVPQDRLGTIAADTRAYSLPAGRFYLNLNGREPRGSVPEDEYEAVRDELADALESFEAPDGRPVCDRVLHKEDAFRGDHDEIAPDLVAIPNDGFDLKADFSDEANEEVFTTGPRTGMHTFDDACLFVDDPSARINDADILDIAPTILSLLDIEYDRATFDGASLV